MANQAKFKVGYISDVHIEFQHREIAIPVPVDAVVVAGDLDVEPARCASALKQLQRDAGVPVLYVLGNHEYYQRRFPHALDEYRGALRDIQGVHLLERESFIVGGVRFLGTTLWTDLSVPAEAAVARDGLNDFRIVRGMTTDSWTEEWGRCAGWLDDELKVDHPGPTVVVTHHSPSATTCAEEYRTSPLRYAFHSHTDGLINNRNVDLWIYGHDHKSATHSHGSTKLASNQTGYPHEQNEPVVAVACLETT